MTEIGRPMFHLVVLVLQQSSAQHIQGGAGRSGTHKTFEYIIIFVTTNPNFTKFSLRVIYGRELVIFWQGCNMLSSASLADDIFP